MTQFRSRTEISERIVQHSLTDFLLKMSSINPNITNAFGENSLHIASRINNATTIEMILSKSASINQRNSDSETALIIAAKNCLTKNVQTLARFNASSYGLSFSEQINVHLTDKHNKTALHHAAMNCDDRDILLVLLKELNANVYDFDSDNKTPLFLAAERAMNNEAIPVLIEFGSDVSYKTGNSSIICDTVYRQNYRVFRKNVAKRVENS